MNLELLFIIGINEKIIERTINSFKLPFNVITKAYGTASKSMLDFFGLERTEKYLSVSIIPDYLIDNVYDKLKTNMKIEKIGNGIGFTVPLSSSSKYIINAFKEGEKVKKEESKYELLMTIVQEGYSDKVMDAAKKVGANGGTLIKGHGLGEKNSFKFFNMTIEPEKDIVLIVCKKEDKNNIMEAILEKTGIKTEGKGVCISLPIDSCVGIN